MRQYHKLLETILIQGTRRMDRTGTGTMSVFGTQSRYNLQAGFPLVTTKKVFWKGVVTELEWMIKGITNVKWLQEKGVHIWDEWADENGDLGPIYGAQWRAWYGSEGTHDQLANVIENIKNDPHSRRHIVNTWHIDDINLMALPPCHVMFQFYVSNGFLDCQLYQRSADAFLGVPFNIASYALLTHVVAQLTGYEPGWFIHTIGDAHIYMNHLDQVHEQLKRDYRPLPFISVAELDSIDDFEVSKVALMGYDPHPPIKGEISV